MTESIYKGRIFGGKYEIIRSLGAGGMGTVWQARDHALNRPVAIKVIRPEHIQTPGAVEGFIKEARIIARLDHPHILGVYDLGLETKDSESLVYLVMKLAGGGTLAERLEAGPLPFEEAERLFGQICDALDYAHGKGVIHLDLKPHNILFDERNSAMIADFGIARLLQGATRAKASTGVGTLAYMPPEQFFGDEAGTFSDVYALGITLHQALTAKLPQRRWAGGATAVHLAESLPLEIRTVIERAIQPDPEQRYRSAGALAQAFKSALSLAPAETPLASLPPLTSPLGPETPSKVEAAAPIRAVVFNPAGDILASAGSTVVQLWDITNDQELRILSGHTDIVLALAFNHDGSTLASGSNDQTIRLWEVTQTRRFRRLPRQLTGHTGIVSSVAFSPDGSMLVSGSDDRTVRLWEVVQNREIKRFSGHASEVECVAFSPDGHSVASGSRDKTICLWNVDYGREALRLEGCSGRIHSVTFDPGGQFLASGSEDNTVRLWDVRTGRQIWELYVDWMSSRRGVNSVVFSPNGQILISGNEDGTVCLWDIKGKLLQRLEGHTEAVLSVAVNPRQVGVLASASRDGTVQLWSIA